MLTSHAAEQTRELVSESFAANSCASIAKRSGGPEFL